MNGLDLENGQKLTPEQKVTLIFDACVLKDLSYRRTQGGTWLDYLLGEVSALPTVNAIIIPSIIADWEMRGGISVYKEKEKKFVFFRVDPSYGVFNESKAHQSRIFKDFIGQATQYRMAVNGHSEFKTIQGANSKLMVVDSAAQHRVTSELADILFDTTLDEKQKKYREKDYQHNDAGENAMEYLASQMPIKGPCFLISNDHAYFRRRMYDDATTKNGKPIGTANLSTYISAAVAALGYKVTVGKVLRDLSLNGLESSQYRLIKTPVYPRLISPGKDADGKPGETLETLLTGERGQNLSRLDTILARANNNPASQRQ